MESIRMLLTFLACAGVCAAQGAPARAGAPPSLVVLKLKWERQIDRSPVARPARNTGGSVVSDPDALNNPAGLRTTGWNPFPPYVYIYSVEVRNDHLKQIRWVSWEYVLTDPVSKRELGRHEFFSSEKIGAGKRKTLQGRTRSTPSRVVDAEGLGKGKGTLHEEHVEFRCVGYDDRTWWHHPSSQESECVEAEKRGKSR
ncbi:MAG: hypothetical protein LC802_10505 [Acidobacteria bacterium]|nr:hypothetical protein [Acidobacteriota bacterium]